MQSLPATDPAAPAACPLARLSAALGVPVIDGAMSMRAGTCVEVTPAQLDAYRDLMTPGSLAVVDRDAGTLAVRLGCTETWLLASVPPEPGAAADRAGNGPAALDVHMPSLDWAACELDAGRANRAAARIAQTDGFATVARKPRFRDDFAAPLVRKWYADDATDWHVAEVAARARNLWEYGVLPRDAKAMRDDGHDLSAIATALGVGRARAKWAIELPDALAMTAYL